jgi:hypothetical protein
VGKLSESKQRANILKVKMPQKHGAQLSKRQKTSLANQKRAVSTALDDEEAFFGRVLKINMGRCVVNIWNHEVKRHMEVQARLPNKKKGVIRLNDLVNIAPSHPDWEVQIALDSKMANDLRKSGRITAELAFEPVTGGAGKSSVPADDCGIEFDYDAVEEKELEDEEALAAIASEKAKKGAVDDDVDVDNI